MNFKSFLVIFGLLAVIPLAGCNTVQPDLIVTHYKPILPPQQFFNCNVQKLPENFTSNKDVAILLNKVYNDNVHCKNNLNAIRAYNYKAVKEFGN